MKKVLAVFVLLAVATGAFAVSGKMYTRFNWEGPVFEYWAGAGTNVDLWQQKDGTGFDLNFDAFGITYKMRPALSIPYGLETFNGAIPGGYYDELGWGNPLVASSPGYLKIRDIKAGPLNMQIGLSWHQAFATSWSLSTNTNGTTNSDGAYGLTYNKFYIDYKFDLPLGDMITIKQYDWDLMHFEFDFGNATYGGNKSLTNDVLGGSSFLAYVPLNVLINLDPVNLTVSPLFVYDTTTTRENLDLVSSDSNNIDETSKMKVGGYVRASVGLLDFLSVYAMGGFYYTSTYDFDRDVLSTASIVTNSRSSSSSIAIPAFAGVVLALGPGIKATVGWGIQYASTTTVNDNAGTNLPGVTTTSWFSRYGYNSAVAMTPWTAPKAEFGTYGDNMMDLAFLRFGSDAKFAGNWNVTIAAAVGLNDKWSYWYRSQFQNGETVTGLGTGTVATSSANQMFSFLNFMNYDRQMNIKYEDANVAIKGTIAQEGNKNYTGTISGNNDNYSVTSLFGMFEYVDITIKF